MLDNAYRDIAYYISKNINSPSKDMDLDTVRKYALLGQTKVNREKLKVEVQKVDSLLKDVQKKFENAVIRKKYHDSLDDIRSRQDDSKQKITDTIYNKTEDLENKLSSRQTEAMNRILDKIEQDSNSLFEKHLEVIRNGGSEIAEKINDAFSGIDKKIPTVVTEIKSAVSEFEQRLFAAKMKELESMPKPPETQQVYIEETGQFITVSR